jgi:hypothetical protein
MASTRSIWASRLTLLAAVYATFIMYGTSLMQARRSGAAFKVLLQGVCRVGDRGQHLSNWPARASAHYLR